MVISYTDEILRNNRPPKIELKLKQLKRLFCQFKNYAYLCSLKKKNMENKTLTERERINALVFRLGISIRKLAQIVGMNENTFYHITDNSRFGISERTASKICYNLEEKMHVIVNRQWLLTGEGDMLEDDSVNNEQQVTLYQSDSGRTKPSSLSSEELKELLLKNHNIILTGAPGTGKTYMAKQLAQQIIFGSIKNNMTKDEEKRFNKQCGFVQFHPSYDYTDFIEGLRPIDDGREDIVFERRNGVFKDFCKDAITYADENHVFIIDEINRGEISKIFGELFFSIDPKYRGTKGRVKTQYQNLIKEDDVFYEGFYVPDKVYIIGTMNDIDRSVESMDFAFRRRFAFKEVSAKESQQMLDSSSAWGEGHKPSADIIQEIKKRMDALNEAICPEDKSNPSKMGIKGLSSAYHIGASYFLKLANYSNGKDSFDFDKLWTNHLKGLLYEYLRGMSDAEEKLVMLKNAFDNNQS